MLAPADEPDVFAFALAPAVIATADASAPNSKLPLVNVFSDCASWKNTIWLYAWPPNWKPTVTCDIDVSPLYLPFSYTRPLPYAPPTPTPPLPIVGNTAYPYAVLKKTELSIAFLKTLIVSW